MQKVEHIMGMPVIIEIDDPGDWGQVFERAFTYFRQVDEKFSPYKVTSELTKINQEKIPFEDFSNEMKEIFLLSEQTKKDTKGCFDIQHNGVWNTSGIVKGWAINNAAKILSDSGVKNFFVNAGSDIQIQGLKNGKKWQVGIRNPFNTSQNVKVLSLTNVGVATSGNYERGKHIWNPVSGREGVAEIASMTVIGPNVFEADRFATAAFAMGERGVEFIENLVGFEGYMVDNNGTATMTSGLGKYL